MAGLNLNSSFSASRGNVGGSAGVAAALPPSYAASAAGATISARAYGVGSNNGAGPRTAALGGTIAGVAGAAVLLYLWWTLPR